MSSEKSTQEKTTLHPRNKNRERYDLSALITAVPELASYIKPNKFGDDSVDFASPIAVKLLNKALLHHYYGVEYWDFPEDNLVPPIPGRADYIHYMADLLTESNFGRKPAGNKITCLDVGTGASCIYPILGVIEYGWNFIASDVNAESLASAQDIITGNPLLDGKVDCRLQNNPKAFFDSIITANDKVDITVCNPPFHASAIEASSGAKRKMQNLSGKKIKTPELNFSGISSELIYDGGEHQFIHDMIADSKRFSKACYWFSTLVSKQSNLKGIYKALDTFKAVAVKTIEMGTGNKSTRIVAWTFLTKEEQKAWRDTNWKSTVKE
jgi:23S rRNA (adenine1618-N6)-methyltransferase